MISNWVQLHLYQRFLVIALLTIMVGFLVPTAGAQDADGNIHHFYAREFQRPRNELILDYRGQLLSIKANSATLQTNQSQLFTIFNVSLRKFSHGDLEKLSELTLDPHHTVVFHNLHLADVRPVSDRSSKSVKSDCSENKIAPETIFNLASTSQDLFDFLSKLPKDTLQKFTLAYHSESQQEARFDLPRVVRFSVDAKLILAYRGIPDSEVEMIYFDDETKAFHFASINFNQGKATRIGKNEDRCMSCHMRNNRRTMPAPIWQGYNRWDGFFGSDDDALDDDVKNDEVSNLLRIKKQKDNVAYALLPWSTEDDLYPYYNKYEAFKPRNYHYRPNAHLSIALSFLKAQQLTRAMFTGKGARLKYLALLNELKCSPHLWHFTRLKTALGSLSSQKADLDYQPKPDDIGSGKNLGSNMYEISRILNLNAEDWNLEIRDSKGNRATSPNYQTATYPIHEYVTGALLIDVISKEAPELMSELRFLNLMSNFSGDQFSCLESEVGVENLSDSSRDKICKFLEHRQRNIRRNR